METHNRLLAHHELPEPLCGLTLRYLLALSRKGAFVPAVRLTPHSPPRFVKSDVDRFLAERIAGREVGQ